MTKHITLLADSIRDEDAGIALSFTEWMEGVVASDSSRTAADIAAAIEARKGKGE